MKERQCVVCCKFSITESLDKQFICSEYCSIEFYLMKICKVKTTRPCCICGRLVTRPTSILFANFTCGSECSTAFRSKNMSGLNIELNPTRMENFETRVNVRNGHLALNKGEGKAYKKIHGRHVHRVVAEEKIGRPLLPGEVVHHKDENRLNNDPDNLEVLESQAEHARIHMLDRWKEVKNDI